MVIEIIKIILGLFLGFSLVCLVSFYGFPFRKEWFQKELFDLVREKIKQITDNTIRDKVLDWGKYIECLEGEMDREINRIKERLIKAPIQLEQKAAIIGNISHDLQKLRLLIDSESDLKRISHFNMSHRYFLFNRLFLPSDIVKPIASFFEQELDRRDTGEEPAYDVDKLKHAISVLVPYSRKEG